MARSRLLAAGAITLLVWTFIALVYTPQVYMHSQRSPDPLSWPQAFLPNAAVFYLWALLTPLVIALGHRWPLERRRLVAHVLLHLVAGFAVSGIHVLMLRYVNLHVLAGLMPLRPTARWIPLLVGVGASNVMVYWGIVAASQALTYFRRYQDRELRLMEAQLQALRVQLHPHFLFNTLNAIAELIYDDPARAEQTLTKLSSLLRIVLARGQQEHVPLAEEVAFLRSYLDIQQILLDERLQVEWCIDDDVLDARVPALILQPLVENAVRHGIAPRASGGRIRIEARRERETLRLLVEDDGVGLNQGSAERTGVGLTNTRARLRHLYGGLDALAVRPGPGGVGVTVSLGLPYQPMEDAR